MIMETHDLSCAPRKPFACVQVSPPRLGKVTACDAASRRVEVVPWPDPSLHPLLAEQALADGFDHYFEPDSDAEEDADQLEEPPSDYTRSGTLEADLSSLQDVRLVAAAAGSASGGAAAGAAVPHDATAGSAASGDRDGDMSAEARGSGALEIGASDAGRGRGAGRLPAPAAAELSHADAPQPQRGLGPPRPGSTGRPTGASSAKGQPNVLCWVSIKQSFVLSEPSTKTVSSVHECLLNPGWADVAAALRMRRAELLSKQEARSDQSAHGPAAEMASASATAAALPTSHSTSEPAPASDGARQVAASVATPSVVRPRGGVRQSALGPLLARLRSEPGN